MQEANNVLPCGRAAQRKQPAQRQIPVLVTMPQSLIDRLDDEAVRRGLDSRSELVRMLCGQGLPTQASA